MGLSRKIGWMSRPRILIPIPTSFDEPYNTQSWPEYAEAIANVGGDPVKVSLTHSAAELEGMLAQASGVLLPGSGADVDPARYGHPRIPACAEADRSREQTDRALLESAERMRKPLLGICLGAQSLNVFHGGTLIQDLLPLPVNHRAGRAVQVAHSAIISPESRLARILSGTLEALNSPEGKLRVPVNSSHHQAVAIAGESLRVVARCPDDGCIEAVESNDPDRWLIGVQWHPERTFSSSASSKALFGAFLTAAAV